MSDREPLRQRTPAAGAPASTEGHARPASGQESEITAQTWRSAAKHQPTIRRSTQQDTGTQTRREKPPVRRRFSWPLRIALSLAVFDMLFRSMLSLTPFDNGWRKELKIAQAPLALPSVAERARITNGDDSTYASLGERYQAVGSSIARYFNPIPREKSKRRISDPADALKYAATWVGTRLKFLGTVLGVDQKWVMFSPNVSRKGTATRVLLHYEDETTQQVRFLNEPHDPTSFSRWLIKRPLKMQSRMHRNKHARRGMNNYLSRRYAKNSAGALLTSINYHKVIYPIAKPTHRARKPLDVPSKATMKAAYYRYDVQRDKEHWLEKKKKTRTGQQRAKKDKPKRPLRNGQEDLR